MPNEIDRDKHAYRKREPGFWSRNWLTFFNGSLGLINIGMAGVIAWATIAILGVTQSQRDIADKANRILTQQNMIIAGQSEILSQQSAIMSSQSAMNDANARRQLRAYITIRPMNEVWMPATGGQTWIFFRNAGQTPASEITLSAAIQARAEPPDTAEFTDAGPPEIIDALEPNTEIREPKLFTGKYALGEAESASLKDGKTLKFYVWGTVAYADVFGDQHRTFFCYSFFGLKRYTNQPNPVNNGIRAGNRHFCVHPKND